MKQTANIRRYPLDLHNLRDQLRGGPIERIDGWALARRIGLAVVKVGGGIGLGYGLFWAVRWAVQP